MDVQAELARLSRYARLELLARKAGPALELFPENIENIIPSFELGGDGVVLNKLLLVSDRYLAEVAVGGEETRSEFDFIAKDSIANYRFVLWTHEIREGPIVRASYDLAQVVLAHDEPKTATTLTYAGNQRQEWIKHITQAIPLGLVLSSNPVG